MLAEAHLKSSFQDWRLGLACAQSLLTNSDNKYRRSLTSSHPPQVCQTAQPHGSGAVFGLAIRVRSRSGSHRPGTSLVWVCCFQGFSSHHHGRETEAAQVISLPRHCYVLPLVLPCACHLSYQDVQTVQGSPLLWNFWGFPKRCYPGRALGRWDLSARHKVRVFTVFVPICQVLAVRSFVLCRLLKWIQSHSNYYCSH